MGVYLGAKPWAARVNNMVSGPNKDHSKPPMTGPTSVPTSRLAPMTPITRARSSPLFSAASAIITPQAGLKAAAPRLSMALARKKPTGHRHSGHHQECGYSQPALPGSRGSWKPLSASSDEKQQRRNQEDLVAAAATHYLRDAGQPTAVHNHSIKDLPTK